MMMILIGIMVLHVQVQVIIRKLKTHYNKYKMRNIKYLINSNLG